MPERSEEERRQAVTLGLVGFLLSGSQRCGGGGKTRGQFFSSKTQCVESWYVTGWLLLLLSLLLLLLLLLLLVVAVAVLLLWQLGCAFVPSFETIGTISLI